jgi:hypothetical protein
LETRDAGADPRETKGRKFFFPAGRRMTIKQWTIKGNPQE